MAQGTGYRERLLPHWWVWLLVLAMVAMLAVAYGAALGVPAGAAVAVVGGALVCWLVWMTSPTVVVDATGVAVASARLPYGSIAAVEALDAAAIAKLRGPGSDARLYVALRPWSSSTGVLIRLDDPEDPHPGWLFSSRHPARVAAAIAATMAPATG